MCRKRYQNVTYFSIIGNFYVNIQSFWTLCQGIIRFSRGFVIINYEKLCLQNLHFVQLFFLQPWTIYLFTVMFFLTSVIVIIGLIIYGTLSMKFLFGTFLRRSKKQFPSSNICIKSETSELYVKLVRHDNREYNSLSGVIFNNFQLI